MRVSDPGVAGAEPRDAHDLTGRGIMPVSALTPPGKENPHNNNKKNPPRNGVQDHGQRQAELPAGLRGGSSSRLKERRGGWGGGRGGRKGGRLAAHRLLLINTQLHLIVVESSLCDRQRLQRK